MPCLTPRKVVNPSVNRLLKLRRYERGELSNNQSNDYRKLLQTLSQSLFVYVPCGRCVACRRARRADLLARLRLAHEKHRDSLGVFLTLTFSERALHDLQTCSHEVPEKHRVSQLLRRFWDRVRKRLGNTPPHFIIDELGARTGRYHLHGIAYIDRSHFPAADAFEIRRKLNKFFADCWLDGYVYAGWCSDRTISYVSKYITKPNPHDKSFIPRTWTSRNFYYSDRRAVGDRAALVCGLNTAVLHLGGRQYPYPRSYRQRLQGFWERLPSRIAFLETPFNARYYSIPGVPSATYSAWQSYYSSLAERYILPAGRPANSDIGPDYDFGLPF